MGRTAYTEPQCLYKGALYLFLQNPKHTMPLSLGNNFVSLRVIFCVFTGFFFPLFISVSFVMISHIILFRVIESNLLCFYWIFFFLFISVSSVFPS